MGFFDKPEGVGAGLNIYMFSPRNLIINTMTAICQPLYFWNRLRVMIFQLIHPNYPWLTAESLKLMEKYLRNDMVGLEWGSGRSTIWFARRLATLISVEHNEKWYNRVRADISKNNIKNVDYRYIDIKEGCSEYVDPAKTNENKFDFVLVDGECRYECLAAAARNMKKGGYLVLDNADLDYGVSDLDLHDFKIIHTDNGVWRTDIYIYDPAS